MSKPKQQGQRVRDRSKSTDSIRRRSRRGARLKGDSLSSWRIRFYDPGAWNLEPQYWDDAPAERRVLRSVRRSRDAVLAATHSLRGNVDRETHGVQALEDLTWLLVVRATLRDVVWIAGKLADFLQRARGVDGGTDAETDRDGLLALAYREVQRKDGKFFTDPELVQTLEDGHRMFAQPDAKLVDRHGFARGTFLFRIPNLATKRTHVLEIRSNGTVLSHHVRAELDADASAYLEENPPG